MASWMPENTAKRHLDYMLAGVTPPASGPLELVFFSTVPTPAGAATDGVEASTREPVTFPLATTATGARIMQSSPTAAVPFVGMLVGYSEVEGWGLFDTTLAEFVLINDNWRPKRQFAAGDDFTVYASELVVFGAYGP